MTTTRRRQASRTVLELIVDRHRPTGRILLVDGVPQSYVDLQNPTYLPFDYTRRMGALIDAAAPNGEPSRVLHLGGGALTLPRYVATTRPGSAQVVVERNAPLLSLVRAELPPPAGELTIRLADARESIEKEPAEHFDLVLADVYQAARMPGHVASVEFAEQAARVLRPDGIYAVNLTDLPPLVFSRVQVATLRAAFAEVCLLASRAMLGGRRYGNIVLAAALRPGRLPVRSLAARVARDPVPGRVLSGAELDLFAGGAQPLTDAELAARSGFSGAAAE